MFPAMFSCSLLICSVGVILQSNLALSEPYFGKALGELSTEAHGVKGSVYAGTDQILYIRDFYYDGLGPDAYVWMGSETEEPSPQGEIVAVNGSKEILSGYSNGVLRINLEDKRLTDYKWLSIWCRQFTVNFGHVSISTEIIAPSPRSLGSFGFDQRVHNVHAEDVIILNHRQIQLVELDYDGNGPDAFYWAGLGDTPTADGFAVEDEYGSTEPLEVGVPFNDKTVTLTVPEDRGSVFDIGHIGLWCVRFTEDFGHADIPHSDDLNVPPFDSELTSTVSPIPPTYAPPSLDNCEVILEDTYQVRWSVMDNTSIEISLSGRFKPGNYLAFGISGSDTRTQMYMSDVTVAWLDPVTGLEAMAVDYYLSDYQQCVLGDGPGSGTGACPDELSQPAGTNDVIVEGFSNVYGIITISITKLLDTGDSIGDKVIPLDDDVYISWAIGPINPSGLAAKHRQQPTKDYMINFGRQNSTCPPFSTGDNIELPPWEIEPIGEKTTDIRVEIGQAGGQQGYEGITGSPGWGIAWYVNSQLIPEITVQRNKKYTFTVHGGNDPEVAANYHPFYITNDAAGGYAQKTPEEKIGVEIYAGPTAGSLCEWRSIGLFNPDDYDTFEAYRENALELQCEAPLEAGTMEWIPDEDTPDIVYYHCYTHKYLGWKITVVGAATLNASVSSLALVISVLFAVFTL